MPLSDAAIRSLKPKSTPYKRADAYGLFLQVSPTGSKLWRLKYRFNGKEKLLALGAYPAVSLKEARARCERAREELAHGIDPSEAKKTRKTAETLAVATTFQFVSGLWFQRVEPDLVPAYAVKVWRSLELDVFPAIGARPIAEIRPPEVLALLRKIEARGTLETAKRVRQRCQDVFTFAITEGLREAENPVVGLEKAIRPPKPKYRASLHVSQLPAFFLRLDAARLSLPVKLALQLSVLLFLRPGELRSARWTEIDFEKATWIVPGERDRARGLIGMKMKEPHVVPLPRQAVGIFQALRAYSGDRELVFPNRNDPARPMSNGTLNSALRALGYAGDEVTGHGFRATAASALAEMGFRKEVIDRQLSHKERNQVLAGYIHQAEYLDERRTMMQEWADMVENMMKPKEGAA